jgi:hypothetical protein
VSQHKEQCGFVTFAINTPETNYLELAYLQALNIKATQSIKNYAVLVDETTLSAVTDKHRKVFDYIIQVGSEWDNPFAAEPFVFYYTPFKETIKLESDLLFTRSIDHWWTAFRLRDVCLATGAENFMNYYSVIRKYREMFDANALPDTYNGLMYFRYSKTAKQFFDVASDIFDKWEEVKKLLKRVDGEATTDIVYALAALVVGEDQVTMPTMDFLNFVHMKSEFNGWSDTRSWIETVMNERDGDVIRINNLNQYAPVHYYDKNYATDELIDYYEQRLLGRV